MSIKVELRKAFEAQSKAVVSYQAIIAELKTLKVKPENVNSYLYSLFSDWPMKENKEGKKKYLGLNNTLKDNPAYMPAKYVNAFSVWRTRTFDAGTYNEKSKESKEKAKQKKLKADRAKEQVEEQEKGAAVAGSIREIDVPKYLALIAELAKKKGNEKAYEMCLELNKVFHQKAVAKMVQKKGKRK